MWPVDRETNNSPGSLLTKQWPEIRHVFQSGHLDDYIRNNVLCVVAEKLDGSNLSVSSRGVVASRRTVLLNNPDQQQLEKYKFSGVNLGGIRKVMEKSAKLQKIMQEFFPFLEVEVLIFGELVQRGTASSKEDKFGYCLLYTSAAADE